MNEGIAGVAAAALLTAAAVVWVIFMSTPQYKYRVKMKPTDKFQEVKQCHVSDEKLVIYLNNTRTSRMCGQCICEEIKL